MAEPFLSEIRLMSFIFAPKGWAQCNGQLLPINQNQGLFSLLGTTYGGDGRVNFALPDLRGRVPIHVGDGHTLGEKGGETQHTLSMSEMPHHVHILNASSSAGNSPYPHFAGAGHVLAREIGNPYSASKADPVPLNPASVTSIGGNQAHENMQPSLVLNFCIATIGIFPSPT